MPNPLIYLPSSRKQTARKVPSLIPHTTYMQGQLLATLPPHATEGGHSSKDTFDSLPSDKIPLCEGRSSLSGSVQGKLARTTYLRFSSSQTFRKSYSLPFPKMPNKGDTSNLFSHKMNR